MLAEYEPTIRKTDAAIGSAREQIEQAVKLSTLRERADKAREDARKWGLESESLTQAIKDLDEARTAKLKELPIPDLTVEDGKVMYRGLPWTKEIPNTAERILLGFQIGRLLQADRTPFFICDAHSDLDAENLEVLRAGLEQAGYQAIGAKVKEEGPLEVVAA